MRKRFRLLTALAVCVIAVGALSAAAAPRAVAAASPAPRLDGTAVPTADAGQLQEYIQRYPGVFAGEYIDSAAGTLTVDVAASSATSGDGLLAEGLGALPAAPGSSRLRLSVRTVRYSQRRLQAVMGQIPTRAPWAAAVRPVLASWGIDPGSDTVQVGVTHISPGLAAIARTIFGNMVTLVTGQRFQVAQKFIALPPGHRVVGVTPHRGSTATGRVPAAAPFPSRLLDATPYYGGDRIYRLLNVNGVTYVGQCTVAFMWETPAMSTAGHCGPTGTVWTQGYYDTSNKTLYKTGTMGTAFSTQFGNNLIDGQLMNNGSWDPEVYNSLTGYEDVSGHGIPVIGDVTCTDGSFTNENCTAKISKVNTCLNVTYKDPTSTYTVYECGQDIATSTNSSVVCQPGDSGGPVYRYTGALQVAADGIISACSSDKSPGGTTVVFTDILQMIRLFGGDVETVSG